MLERLFLFVPTSACMVEISHCFDLTHNSLVSFLDHSDHDHGSDEAFASELKNSDFLAEKELLEIGCNSIFKSRGFAQKWSG